MRTASLPLFALFALAGGCNTFQTVDEACLDSVPGEDAVTAATDKAIVRRMNCYRRLAKRPRAPVNKAVQEAVEAHGDWIDLNRPSPESLRNENRGSEGFTGFNSIERLEAAGFIFPANSEVLEVITIEQAEFAGFWVGPEHFDFWFADPFLRPSFLQPIVSGTGVTEGLYEREFPPETEVPNLPVSYMYWNVIYAVPPQPYAEVPVMYPRSGQTDAPPVYQHLSGNQSLELGRTYGYPITFTVGSRETGLTVTQASLREVGSEVELPFTMLTGNDAITALRLRNTAIMVPEQVFTPGRTYQANVKIKTDQGERRASTVFTVGTESRDVPAGLLRQVEEFGIPLYDYSVTRVSERLGD
jgi:hypothetical protein